MLPLIIIVLTLSTIKYLKLEGIASAGTESVLKKVIFHFIANTG
jgi:hypothetical protein